MGLDGFAENMGPEFDEAYRQLMTSLEERTRKMGLYLETGAVATEPETGRLVIMTNFIIGDVAWSNRVLSPDKSATDKVVAEMDDTMSQEEIEALRQDWLNRRNKGGDDAS